MRIAQSGKTEAEARMQTGENTGPQGRAWVEALPMTSCVILFSLKIYTYRR